MIISPRLFLWRTSVTMWWETRALHAAETILSAAVCPWAHKMPARTCKQMTGNMKLFSDLFNCPVRSLRDNLAPLASLPRSQHDPQPLLNTSTTSMCPIRAHLPSVSTGKQVTSHQLEWLPNSSRCCLNPMPPLLLSHATTLTCLPHPHPSASNDSYFSRQKYLSPVSRLSHQQPRGQHLRPAQKQAIMDQLAQPSLHLMQCTPGSPRQ